MHVIIVGAGIGGTTAALCCLREGLQVTLLEQATELREVGAGVQISSNGSVVFRELGLLEKLDRVAVKPVSFQVISFETGEVVSNMPLGPAAAERYGATFFQFHRADLLDVLGAALPHGIVQTNHRVISVEQDDISVSAILENGTRITGDVLIGADGIHSAVRKAIVGDGGTTFSGKLVWRALVQPERIKSLDFKERFYGWAGKGRMVWGYWVRPKTLFNFGGVVPSDEVRRETWTQTGDLAEMRASFAGANPRLTGLIDAVDEAFITGLYDRDPLPLWTKGRATLLGDAGHAMLPYLAQGATQSVEDGYVLARCLAKHGARKVPEALADYELRRRPRTTKVQTVARATHIFWTDHDQQQNKARDGRLKGLAQIDPLATTIWRWLYAHNVVDETKSDVIKPDKRGIRSEYAEDTPEQKRAWHMWHDLFTVEEEARGIRGLRAGYDRFFGQFKSKATTAVREVGIGRATALWVEPQGTTEGPVVLHLHGGGFAFGSARCSVEFCERLAEAINGRCLALEYRLAPENPFPAALDDACAAFAWLQEQGVPASQILISGESAGGGLALSTALALKQARQPNPAGLYLLSPLVDCTLSSPSIDAMEGKDPIIDRDILTYMATGYFQATPAQDPLVSPIFADLSKLPPILVQASKHEVLVDDAKRLATKAGEDGVNVQLQLFEERLHIFATFPFLPNASAALQNFGDFSRQVLASG